MDHPSQPGLDATVIIATRDRAASLRGVLEALTRQRTEGIAWELIVVDNGSTDDTASVLAAYAAALPLTVIYYPVAGKNRALNRALRIARGRLLLFTDDDIALPEQWIAEICAAADGFPQASLFCGPIRAGFKNAPPPWLERHWFAGAAFAAFHPSLPPGPLPDDRSPCGGNLAIRRSAMQGYVFEETIGPQGADYPMGSELELIKRLRLAGHETVYVPTAEVLHHIRDGQTCTTWLFGRAYRFGRGAARMEGPSFSRRVFGTPWPQLVLLPVLWLRHLIGRLQGQFWYVHTGILLHSFRGRMAEHRRPSGPMAALDCPASAVGIAELKRLAFNFYAPLFAGQAYVDQMLQSDQPQSSQLVNDGPSA